MSKKRSSLDYTTYEFSDCVSSIGSATVAGVIFTAWVAGLCLHVCYNIYVGYKSSTLTIERQTNWHKMCLREPQLREEQFDLCQKARIDKDLSVAWTTVNHVLHNTNICIVTSCYSAFMDLVNNLGWLFVGVALVAVILFWISSRYAAQSKHLAHESQPIKYIDLNERRSDRLVEIKSD